MPEIECSSCQQSIQDTDTFCRYCGTTIPPVDVSCPSCNTELPNDSQFCSKCGSSISIEMVSFPRAVKLGFLNYFNFRGRSTRAEYWWWVLFCFLTALGLATIDGIVSLYSTGDGTGVGLYDLSSLVLFIPGTSVSVRRLHDINRSGWWVYSFCIVLGVVFGLYGLAYLQDALLPFVVAVTVIAFLPVLAYLVIVTIFCATKGNFGSNKYGSDPRNPSGTSKE